MNWNGLISHPALPGIALVLALAHGAFLRADRLLDNPSFVHPDALKHFIAAEEIRAGEPLTWFAVHRGYLPFAWTVRAAFGLGSHTPVTQRLVTVLYSVLLIVLVAWVAGSRLGPWAGALAAYLTAISPALIESSDNGIREDFLACFWIALFALLFAPIRVPGGDKVRWGLVGFLSWVILLTRIDSALALLGMLLLAGIHRRAWTQLGVVWRAPAVFAALLLPVVVANGLRYGDPCYFVDREKKILRYWANLEFKGKPGFPSAEEVAANSRIGDSLSALEYFGGVLGWSETASRFAHGYWDLFRKNILTGVYAFSAYPNQIGMVGILTLVGLGLALYRRQWALPLSIPLLVVGTIWTYNIAGGRDFRLYQIVIPFTILLAVEGAVFLLEKARALPWPRMQLLVRAALVLLVVSNPWNHALATSFPWRVGPVSDVPMRARFVPPMSFGNELELVGSECLKVGSLGQRFSRFDSLRAGDRFLVRLYWRKPEMTVTGGGSVSPPPNAYVVSLDHDTLGTIGMLRPHPLTEKHPLAHWLPGQVVLDEIEYLVYPNVRSGRVRVVVQARCGEERVGEPRGIAAFTLRGKSPIVSP